MANIDIYVHGVPYGQDIWCAGPDKDYISTFYSHDSSINESVLFRIEIMRNKTFYSYLKYLNVINSEGRSGSYFGLTVGFDGQYCGNTSLLYKIFEAVYQQICVNNLVKNEGNVTRYMVGSFAERTDVMNTIKSAFEQQVDKLILPFLSPLDSNFRQNGVVRFSLTDVDSPYFVENLKAHKIIVSPEINSLVAINRQLQSQVTPLNDKIVNLNAQLSDWKTKAEQLDARLNEANQHNLNIQSKVDALTKDLSKAEEVSAKKYKSTVDQLQAEVKQLKQQKDESLVKINQLLNEKSKSEAEVSRLRNELNSVGSSKQLRDSITTIAPSIKQLARQMASQFPDVDGTGPQDGDINNAQDNEKSHQFSFAKDWKTWVNYLLLLIVIALLLWVKIPSLNGSTPVDPTPAFNYSAIKRIDLDGGGPNMNLGESCRVQLLDNHNISIDAPGKWVVDNALFDSGSNTVTFNLEGETSIQFFDDAGNCVTQRKINVTGQAPQAFDYSVISRIDLKGGSSNQSIGSSCRIQLVDNHNISIDAPGKWVVDNALFDSGSNTVTFNSEGEAKIQFLNDAGNCVIERTIIVN